MICLIILLFIIQNIIHHRIIIYIVENSSFLFLWNFKVQMKMSFMVLKILLFGFGVVLEIFKGVCTIPEKHSKQRNMHRSMFS